MGLSREMPYDVVRLTLEFYYHAHDEWLNQTFTVHIADERHDRRHGSFLNGVFVKWDFDAGEMSGFNIEFGNAPDVCADQPFSDKYPLWRASASVEDRSLTLNLASVDRSHSLAVLGHSRYNDYTDYRWRSETELSFTPHESLQSYRSYDKGIELQLHQPNLDRDEYYFERKCDGRYVVANVYGRYGSYDERPRLELTDDVSRATLFGLTQRHLPQLPTDKVMALKSGSPILYRVRYCSDDPYHHHHCDYMYEYERPDKCSWVMGRVCDKRRGAFGDEVIIDYQGFVDTDKGEKEMSGSTKWIPLTSRDIELLKSSEVVEFDDSDEFVAQLEIGQSYEAYWSKQHGQIQEQIQLKLFAQLQNLQQHTTALTLRNSQLQQQLMSLMQNIQMYQRNPQLLNDYAHRRQYYELTNQQQIIAQKLNANHMHLHRLQMDTNATRKDYQRNKDEQYVVPVDPNNDEETQQPQHQQFVPNVRMGNTGVIWRRKSDAKGK